MKCDLHKLKKKFQTVKQKCQCLSLFYDLVLVFHCTLFDKDTFLLVYVLFVSVHDKNQNLLYMKEGSCFIDGFLLMVFNQFIRKRLTEANYNLHLTIIMYEMITCCSSWVNNRFWWRVRNMSSRCCCMLSGEGSWWNSGNICTLFWLTI